MKAFAWVVTIVYIIIATFIWVCPVKGYCPDGFSVDWFSKSASPKASFSYPSSTQILDLESGLEFPWSSVEARYDTAFQSAINQLAETIKSSDNQLFSVNGLFHPDEISLTDTINLGLARAIAFKEILMSEGAPGNRISVFFGRLPDSAVTYGRPIGNGIEVSSVKPDFDWLKKQDKLNVFRFGRNSSELVLNSFQKALLEQVILYLQLNTDKFATLTGHTSSEGSTSGNIQLGLERAEALKAYLTTFGANPEQILVVSKGEAELLNKPEQTEADRKVNRRVVLSL